MHLWSLDIPSCPLIHLCQRVFYILNLWVSSNQHSFYSYEASHYIYFSSVLRKHSLRKVHSFKWFTSLFTTMTLGGSTPTFHPGQNSEIQALKPWPTFKGEINMSAIINSIKNTDFDFLSSLPSLLQNLSNVLLSLLLVSCCHPKVFQFMVAGIFCTLWMHYACVWEVLSPC